MKFISIALPLTFVFAALASAESFGVPAGTDLKDWKVPTSDMNRFVSDDDFYLGYKGRDVQDDETSSLDRRAIINGVDRTDKKPSAAAKVLTNFIYKVTGWNKGSRSEDEELPNFKRDDFSEDALIARDEIDDESLITRMIDIMDSRSYEEMTPIERRAIINGVDRTDKKPGFASRVLTKLIYKLSGKN